MTMSLLKLSHSLGKATWLIKSRSDALLQSLDGCALVV